MVICTQKHIATYAPPVLVCLPRICTMNNARENTGIIAPMNSHLRVSTNGFIMAHLVYSIAQVIPTAVCCLYSYSCVTARMGNGGRQGVSTGTEILDDGGPFNPGSLLAKSNVRLGSFIRV